MVRRRQRDLDDGIQSTSRRKRQIAAVAAGVAPSASRTMSRDAGKTALEREARPVDRIRLRRAVRLEHDETARRVLLVLLQAQVASSHHTSLRGKSCPDALAARVVHRREQLARLFGRRRSASSRRGSSGPRERVPLVRDRQRPAQDAMP